MEDAQADIDPLFIGMTRPPMVMGVPMEFFGLNFILFGAGIIFFLSLSAKISFFACVTLPLHAAAYIATEKDPHWMRVYLTKVSRCAPIKNRKFWKSNSYQP